MIYARELDDLCATVLASTTKWAFTKTAELQVTRAETSRQLADESIDRKSVCNCLCFCLFYTFCKLNILGLGLDKNETFGDVSMSSEKM